MPPLTPTYTRHDGFPMPPGFPLEAFRSALAYQPRPDDIFVTTYPKCGTTWTQHIVYLILHGGTPMPPEERMTEVFPHIEEVGGDVVAALPTPRCIKTHLPYAMTPQHPRARYIYVARNPFDCVVSFYHHTRGFARYDFAEGTFDAYFECFLSGDIDFGDYFDNLLSWYDHRDDDNLLFLTYEEMKADPARAIIDIADFLGAPWSRSVREAATLDAIVEHSSFDRMKKDQLRWASRRPDGMPAFVRKGEVGDWRRHFSEDQTRRLAERFAERTRDTDLATLWPDLPRPSSSSTP